MTFEDRRGGSLMAELWYPTRPDLGASELLAGLQKSHPTAEADSDSIMIAHTDVTFDSEEGTRPLLTAVLPASELDHQGKSKPDVSQTWDWDGAAAALEPCRASVLVTELMASVFTPLQRVEALSAVVKTMIELTNPAVVSWPQSQQVTNPARYGEHLLDGVVNVRFFTISNDPGAMVMDSIGLHVLDLPDVQCHYRDFDSGEVAAMLFNTAGYLFDHGNVIDDGHTISNPDGTARFSCNHEESLLEPTREVVDIDLGDPYAAGTRDRSTD